MKEALEIDATSGQAASKPSKRLNRVYNCIESLSEQSGAERRHLVKCELVRREQKKKKKSLQTVLGEISLEECDERR
jgi:hypothetical protein